MDVLSHQLPHQVVLGALLPPSQAPQLLSGALRPGDIRTGLKYDSCTMVYSVFVTSVWESPQRSLFYLHNKDQLFTIKLSRSLVGSWQESFEARLELFWMIPKVALQ